MNGYTCLDPDRTDNNVQFCAPGCPTAWSLDYVCNDVCNVASCNFDGGACTRSGNDNHALISTGSTASSTLKEVSVPICDYEKCNAAYAPGGVTEDTLCAGMPEGGPDSCQGDSGGPLVYLNSGVWYQIGIVSWGIGCGWEGYYGVYASVNYHRSWIENFLVDLPFDVVEYNDNSNSLPNIFGNQVLAPVGGEDSYTITINNTMATSGLTLDIGLTNAGPWEVDKSSCSLPTISSVCMVTVTFKPVTSSTSSNSLVITTTYDSATVSKALAFKALVISRFDSGNTINSGLEFYSIGSNPWEFLSSSDFDDLALSPLGTVTVQTPQISNGAQTCLTAQIAGPDLLSFAWATHCEVRQSKGREERSDYSVQK